MAGLLGFVAILGLFPASVAAVQPPLEGRLDRSFGTNGRVFSDLPPTLASSRFQELVRQPDGKLALLGHREVADGRWESIVQRREATGSLDPGFGDGGNVVVPTTKRDLEMGGLGVQDDRRIVFGASSSAGLCDHSSTLRRLRLDGSPDPTFDHDGVSEPIPLTTERIAFDAQGRILVAGTANYMCAKSGVFLEVAVARLTPDGRLDASFGDGGVVGTHERDARGEFDATGLAIADDGDILIAGEQTLLRLSADGSFDSGFGKGGVVEPPGDTKALLPVPGGGAVVAGSSSPRFACCKTGDFVLTHYRADGTLETRFGDAGHSVLDVGDIDQPTALAMSPDGRIVLAGQTAGAETCDYNGCRFTPLLARLTLSGALDSAFGQGGWSSAELPGGVPDFGYDPPVSALAIAPGGQILIAGTTGRFRDAFVLARESDGGADAGFGSGGAVREVRILPSRTEASGLAIWPDGGILVSGWSDSEVGSTQEILLGFDKHGRSRSGAAVGAGLGSSLGTARFGGRRWIYAVRRRHVVRFDARGQRDDRYGVDGMADLPRDFAIGSFRVLRDGGVVVVGRQGGGPGFVALQLTRSGLPDPSFGYKGLARVGVGLHRDEEGALAIAIDRRKRLLIAGGVRRGVVVVRLLPDGRLDRRFGRRGRVGALPLGSQGPLVVRAGRGILLGGRVPGRRRATTILRLRPNGDRDSSFGRDGAVRFRGRGSLLSLFATAGQIVAVNIRRSLGVDGVVLHAYRLDGAVDRHFGRGGIVTAAAVQSRVFRPIAAGRQPDGRIVVVGTAGRSHESGIDVELLRFR